MDYVIVPCDASVVAGVRFMDEYSVLAVFGMAVVILVLVLVLAR